MSTRIARPLLRLAVVSVVALGAGACSTIADLDPTGLLSDDSPEVADSQFPDDANPNQPPDSGTTPDLASLPPRPVYGATPAQQQQVAQAVTAQGAQAQYSADALRAGTEAAAPAPGAAQLPVMVAQAAPPSANDMPPSASDAPPSASDAPPSASDAPPSASPSGVAAVPAVGPAAPRRVAATPVPVEAAPPIAAPAPAPVAVANAAPVPGSQPAVPAVPAAGGNSRVAMLAPPVVSDASLGFKRSEAPALDPSISNWVSAPILARYRQTAAQAGSAGTKVAAVPAAPAVSGGRGSARAVGGPGMSGSVVANMDALSSVSAGSVAANYGGIPPTAIVYFPGDGTSLSPAARTQVREAVNAFKAGGGAGTIRVVGHASSRTANMPVERHLEVIFDKSQKRANAVAQALIRAGVPADKVLVEAVGDSQPVYYESMPKGEDGNRRAEIFVQG